MAFREAEEVESTDQRKKKKNDYLDYYDHLAEQDQGEQDSDPAIAYYDEGEITLEEGRR